MAWIESHTVLLRHRKLIELAKELRLKPVHAMGHLHALWHVALEQQEDGDLSSWTDDFITESSGFPADTPQYVRLLQKHGWLDNKILHDWIDYAGLYLIKKYSTSNPERLRAIWAKHGREYGIANKKRAESEPTVPNLTLPNQPDQQKAFDDFWAVYPNRDGKDKAKAWFVKSKPSAELLKTIVAAVVKQKQSEKWKNENGKFIPLPATWLNGKRWEDEGVVVAPREPEKDKSGMKEIWKNSGLCTHCGGKIEWIDDKGMCSKCPSWYTKPKEI